MYIVGEQLKITILSSSLWQMTSGVRQGGRPGKGEGGQGLLTGNNSADLQKGSIRTMIIMFLLWG